jgi:hypothetical protein
MLDEVEQAGIVKALGRVTIALAQVEQERDALRVELQQLKEAQADKAEAA